MPDNGLFIVSFDLCAAILSTFCLIFLLLLRRFTVSHTNYFIAFLGSLAISAVAGSICTYLQADGILSHPVLLNTANLIYYLIHSLLGYLFLLYVMSVNGSLIPRTKKWWCLVSGPVGAMEVLIALNPIHHGIFYYLPDGTYVRGPLSYVVYGVNLVLLLAALVNLIRYREAIREGSLGVLLSLYVGVAVGLGIQFVYPMVKIELFCEALATLGILFVIESSSTEIDPITLVQGRKNFLIDTNRMFATQTPFTVIAVRITNMDLFARILNTTDMAQVLRDLGEGLRQCKGRPTVYYLRRGEFACVYLHKTKDSSLLMAQHIAKRFETPWVVNGMSVDMHAMIACALIPEDFHDKEGLFSLLNTNFSKPGGGTAVLAGDDFRFLDRRRQVETALKTALQDGSLRIYFQPIWNTKTRTITTAEALSRMISPELGFVSPGEFIPIAEENGMIVDLGRFAFEESCRVYAENHLDQMGIDYIEVNLSLYQLLHAGLKDEFASILQKYGLTPDRINLEITETANLEESELFKESVYELQQFGFHFSLDDFGTGYSNLSDAMKRKFKNIKMDISLLRDADESKESELLLSNLIWTFNSMEYQVIQEGVEDRRQLKTVVTAGARLIQGFYFSKALPEEEFLDYIRHFQDHVPDLTGVPEAIDMSSFDGQFVF